MDPLVETRGGTEVQLVLWYSKRKTIRTFLVVACIGATLTRNSVFCFWFFEAKDSSSFLVEARRRATRSFLLVLQSKATNQQKQLLF